MGTELLLFGFLLMTWGRVVRGVEGGDRAGGVESIAHQQPDP